MNIQIDAFSQFPTAAHRRVRMRKAVQATERADTDSPSWSQQAYAFLCQFAVARGGEFLGEEVISRSRGVVPEPTDKRAWGSVFTKAARAGVIVRNGWSTATRNCSAKPTYVRGKA